MIKIIIKPGHFILHILPFLTHLIKIIYFIIKNLFAAFILNTDSKRLKTSPMSSTRKQQLDSLVTAVTAFQNFHSFHPFQPFHPFQLKSSVVITKRKSWHGLQKIDFTILWNENLKKRRRAFESWKTIRFLIIEEFRQKRDISL